MASDARNLPRERVLVVPYTKEIFRKGRRRKIRPCAQPRPMRVL